MIGRMHSTRRAVSYTAPQIRKRRALRPPGAALILLLATACATPGDPATQSAPPERPDHQLKVANARIESQPGSSFATAYFVVLNKATEPRTIVGASGACCLSIRLERAVLRDGRMASEALSEMEIPAGGAVAFVPRGLSLELDLHAPLADGDSVGLELELENAQPIAFEAAVQIVD